MASINRTTQIYFEVSSIGNPKLLSVGILVPRFPMSQFTDMVPYMLALLAKLLAHVTTISQDHNLISCRFFRHSNAEMYSSSAFAIHRISICQYNDSWPYNGCFSLCRNFKLCNSEVYGLLVHGIPNFPMDDFPFGTFSECSDCHHASSYDGRLILIPGFSL
jgi:hypothetical protein